MKKSTQLFLFTLLLSSSFLFAQTSSERQQISDSYDLDKLAQLEAQFLAASTAEKQKAMDLAEVNGWEEIIQYPNGGLAYLVGVYDNGKPKYYVTHNREGAITTRANKVHTGGGAGLDLNGENMIVGIWEVGDVRLTHPLLENRVTQMDAPLGISDHATHVSGTILGSATPNGGGTKGMAAQATAHSYTASGDTSEMAGAAANGLLVSNHSYGANIANQALWQLGFYGGDAKGLDEVLHNAPYYLPVFSAGNDRQSGINTGDGGYDYLTDSGTAKNNLVIAAVVEVLNYTGPGSVNMSSFSSWGPTDDGRVKPDISAKGVNMYSSVGTAQYQNYSGTSMSAPNTAGSLILLQQHYNELNGHFMYGSTLKGLAIHTADEAGSDPGPDYRFGWGLLNIERGAEVISNDGDTSVIIEDELVSGEVYTMTVQSDGVSDLVASLTWADVGGNLLPAGTEDDPTPALVHDLDLRVSQDGGATFFPWKLDVTNFSAAATNGDNIVDVVEKTEIAGASGEYIIKVSHKGNLTESSQKFSLIITGIAREEFNVSSHDGVVYTCAESGSATFDIDLGFSDGFSDTIDFSVSGLPSGTTGSFDPASMNAEGTTALTVDGIDGLAMGDYPFLVVAEGTSETINLYLVLSITDDLNIGQVELLSPGNNFQNRPRNLTFTWSEGNVNVQGYDIEIALDEAFTNIVISKNVPEATTTEYLEFLDTFYWWRVRATSDCEDGEFSVVYRFKTTPVAGLDENGIDGLVVYPNPTSDMLNIEAKGTISSVEVMNVLGQTVLSTVSTSNRTQIDISTLNAGNYFVRVTSNDNSSVLQVLKQ